MAGGRPWVDSGPMSATGNLSTASAEDAVDERLTVFLATREHGLAMCLAIADRLKVPVASRLLVVADTSRTVEVQPSFPASQRRGYLEQFGSVVDWNKLI